MPDRPRIPDHASTPHTDFPDVDQSPEAILRDHEAHQDDLDADLPWTETPITDFYSELLQNPKTARASALFKAVVAAYARGEEVQNICDTFGVTRTEIAYAVRLAGVRRGMDTYSMAPADVANLYSLLYAAQLEIESLRHELAGKLHSE